VSEPAPAPKPASALYFPYFAPEDGWLKCALLYWDRVYRIVPDEVTREVHSDDPRPVREAREAKLLLETPPNAYRDKAAERFRNQVSGLIADEASRGGADWWRRQSKKKSRVHRDKLGPILENWVHVEKIPQEMQHELRSKQLLRPASKRGYVLMPKIVCDLYMTCLAAEISDKEQFPAFTDDEGLAPGSAQIMSGERTYTPIKSDRLDVLQEVKIEFPSADDLRHVPMAKILEFRKRFPAERRRFRNEIEALVAALAAATTPAKRREIIENARTTIAESMLTRRNLLSEIGVIGFNSMLTLSVPASIKALPAEISQLVNTTLLAVGGILFGAAAGWAKLRQDRRKVEETNPWHYALTVKRKFR
jgi:hypothetical protein